jgi:hypothetical protein
MKRNALLISLAGVAIALAAWKIVPAGTRASATTAPPVTTRSSSSSTAMPVGAAGYVVHLDGNGKMVTEPQAAPDADFNREIEKSINTSSEGLQQVTLPNGAVKMDLQGRFMSAYVATRDANGKVVAPCLTNENDVKAFEKTSAATQAARKE